VAKSYRYFHLDVFCDRLFGGNQLAVFLDGRGLPAETMQLVAREMNFSETTFVLPAEQPGTDARMRIFTPSIELPIAGHPTIGSTFALARAGVIAPDRDQFVFGLGVGPVPVELAWRNGDLNFAWMTQPLPTFAQSYDDPSRIAAALGVSKDTIVDTKLPPQVVSCGVPFLLVALTTRAAVDSATLNVAAYDELLRALPVPASGLFFFSLERGNDKATAYSRMFAPEVGVPEDPATGVASGPLGAYLVRHGLVAPADGRSILSLQGVKMGRPSQVHISITVEGRDIRSVRVGGAAVLAGEGTLYIP
jgi:trans-2,3-dihydro-3-hydroxyanthranilate isomerase